MKSNRRALMLGASAAILAGPVRAQSFPKRKKWAEVVKAADIEIE